jgi:hypothetical protein
MAKAGVRAGLLAGCLLVLGSATPAWAAPTVAEMLSIRPKQEGVVCTIPTPQQEKDCKVEKVKGAKKGSGWVLRDGAGQTLRLFYDANEDNRIDIWSYYKDGVEVYREIDSNFNGKRDQYRWLNSGGMKWGIDENEDGKIDAWKMISAEEVSQEILQAVIKQDFARFQALMITEAEVKSLDLSGADVVKVRELRKGAAAKFQKCMAALPHLAADKTHWLHLETAAPQCVPADAGSRGEMIRYQGGTILTETAGKNDWIQTGEMIQIGLAWRLVDGPSIGLGADDSSEAGSKVVTDKEMLKLLDELRELDAQGSKSVESPGANAEVVRYNLARAELIDKILAKSKPEEKEAWVRQIADCLSAAAQSSPANDKTAYKQLVKFEEQIAEAVPKSQLAAYVTYREMQADYNVRLLTSDQKELNKAQELWLERLAKFVKAYPNAEDTPEALVQLGMVNEFLDKEIEAKNWYAQLAKDFADKPQGLKGAGAIRRLELKGKVLKLAAPLMDNPNTVFDIDQMHGKAVVVFYWASVGGGTSASDFIKLKQVLDEYGQKGLELVCINLDMNLAEAKTFVQRAHAPGTHLHQSGGLESKVAVEYGVMALPNLFLVGKDGKVLSRTVQIANLEDEVKKAVK